MRPWLVVLVLLAAACGGATPSPSAAPRPSRTIVVTHEPAPLPTIVGQPTYFRTSNYDVGCDLEPTYVLCNVGRHTWQPPRKPADCLYTWGDAVEFAIGSAGSFFCGHGESYLDAKRVLPVGQALQVGLVTCRASAGGVECSSQGHGFYLGRSSYRVF